MVRSLLDGAASAAGNRSQVVSWADVAALHEVVGTRAIAPLEADADQAEGSGSRDEGADPAESTRTDGWQERHVSAIPYGHAAVVDGDPFESGHGREARPRDGIRRRARS